MGQGGATSPTGVANVKSILSDARFLPFRSDDFNATAFASRALSGAHASAQASTQELRSGIRVLDGEIRREVTRRQADLMALVQSLSSTEGGVREVESSVAALRSTVEEMRGALLEPCGAIRTKTAQLKNLRDTVELLRHVNHRLKLTAKLRSQLEGEGAGVGDLALAGKLLTEVESVGIEADLTGVDVIEADAEFLRQTGEKIRRQAAAQLQNGLDSLNQADVGNALQVYFNLQELPDAVEQVLSEKCTKLEQKAKAAFDLRQLAAGGVSGGQGGWQEKLWQRVRELATVMQTSVGAIWHLQQVVSKKRDPVSHVCFLDVIKPHSEEALVCQFWGRMARVLGSCISVVTHPSKPVPVREALTQSFPTLASILEGMFDNVLAQTQVKGNLGVLGQEHLKLLLGSCQPIQNAYLATSLSRLSEAVSAAFPGGPRTLPTTSETQKCISQLHEELKAAGASLHATSLVAGNIGKALMLMSERVEYMASTGPEVRAMAGTCNMAQLRNITLCSHVQDVHRSLVSLVPKLPVTAAEALCGPMDMLRSTIVETVAPIFKSAMESMEQIILEMHSLGGKWSANTPGTGDPEVTDTSRYMIRLIAAMMEFRSEYLVKFTPPPTATVPSFIGSLVERMARRVLVFFVRHASLIRPLGTLGRLQLAKDISDLQVAVGQHLYPVERLGPPYKAFRAFRALLFLETGNIQGSPVLKELPRSVVLHHLFSRAPPGLMSPYVRSGLSPSQYSHWIDQQSIEGVVMGIQACLEACQSKAKDQKGFQEVYPVMLELCS